MIQKRETKEDLKKQRRLLEVFSNLCEVDFNQFPSFSKKYRIDGYLYDKRTKDIISGVECKWYNGKAHCFLNVPKFQELVSLSSISGLPSYLLFREYDKWGYILIHDGKQIVCNYSVKLLGGTPNGRVPNEDDIEPLIALNKKDIVWGN